MTERDSILEWIDYNPETGKFHWKKSPNPKIKIGTETGSTGSIKFPGYSETVGKTAWIIVHGIKPKTRMVFLNGDSSDRRISNIALPDREGNSFRSGLKIYYNMTVEDYWKIHDEQQGVCDICNKPEKPTKTGKRKLLSVDHCHESTKVRGLLCNSCNALLGLSKDRISVLESMISYLKEDHERKT